MTAPPNDLQEYARGVIERVNAGEPVLLDPEMEKRMTQGFKVMGAEEIIDRFLPNSKRSGGRA